MIFASDLDRTLIYSKSFIKDEMKDVFPVERKDEIDLSYMSEKSIALLSLLSNKTTFVPVTSRSLEQFRRVFFIKENLTYKYAIVANGGILLKDDKIDLTWKGNIEKQMAEIVPPEEFLLKLDTFLKNPEINSFRCCDKLFIYIVLKTEYIEDGYVESLEELCNMHGYGTVKNNRKIYIIPFFINKWAPLKYIMEMEQESEVFSAGDSILDLPMLKNSTKGFVPAHGELNNDYRNIFAENKNLQCTKENGIYASEEFLDIINKMII